MNHQNQRTQTQQANQRQGLDRLIDPCHLSEALKTLATPDQALIAHVDSIESYREGHVAGAVWVDPSLLFSGQAPARGKIPSEETLSALFSALGLNAERHVIAYDNEGGGWAGRLIWTLEVLGHTRWSYLDGGLRAWRGSNLPLETSDNKPRNSTYSARIYAGYIAELEDVLHASRDKSATIWDARSAEEYRGEATVSARGGHIPGAIHYEWLRLMDGKRNLRLRPLSELSAELKASGINAAQPVITHCQSHHRSALCYLVGRLIGLDISAYHGSWGEWGNRTDTPVVTGSEPY